MSKIDTLYELFLKHPVVSTDTRNIQKDSIFFALKGENFDANKFAHEALKKGAFLAVVDDPSLKGDGIFQVDDALQALQDLARLHRKNFKGPVIGLTGSNGKTTTKELLNAVLSKKYNVLSTAGNFNNHIGVPLTLLRLNEKHNMAIIEMGANHVGEIGFLCSISDPDYGLITNLGKAHLKGFGSFEGVIQAKTDLFRHIASKQAHLFVNADDEILMKYSDGIERTLYGGQSECTASNNIAEDGKIDFVLGSGQNARTIHTNLFGSYNFLNLLATYCVGRYFEVNEGDIAAALAEYQPTNNRSQILRTKKNTIVLDAYNANPSSMALAIKSFGQIPGERKVVIVGDMLELGEEEVNEHKAIVELIRSINPWRVYLVGPIFQGIQQKDYTAFKDVDELNVQLEKDQLQDSSILIKGSRGIKLEKCLDFID